MEPRNRHRIIRNCGTEDYGMRVDAANSGGGNPMVCQVSSRLADPSKSIIELPPG